MNWIEWKLRWTELNENWTRVEVRPHEWILNEAVDARGASNDKIEQDIDQVMQ